MDDRLDTAFLRYIKVQEKMLWDCFIRIKKRLKE